VTTPFRFTVIRRLTATFAAKMPQLRPKLDLPKF
jgi:hypothetical protein